MKNKLSLGTKSILWGAHHWLIHPFFVWVAWCKLYGFTLDPRILIACFVHDWGYWGMSTIDGPDGELHAELGGRIMHLLFDRNQATEMVNIWIDGETAFIEASQSWPKSVRCDANCCVHKLERSTKWRDFCWYHSRTYAMNRGERFSRLCVADKFAFCLEPWWLYLPRVLLSGEIREFQADSYRKYEEHGDETPKEWLLKSRIHVRQWVEDHRNYGG